MVTMALEWPVAKVTRSRLVDDVTDQLRELILNGEFAPGLQLRQIELSERLGISRTPLREAFRLLERDGPIRISNGNKRVEVVSFTAAEIIDLYEVREVLDGLAARLCATRGISAEVDSLLRGHLDAMDRSLRPLDEARYGQCHTDFHSLLLTSAGNSRLTDLLPVIRMSSQLTLTRFLRNEAARAGEKKDAAQVRDLLRQGNEDHRAIYDAIASGRESDAERLARRHIHRTMRELKLTMQAVAEPSAIGAKG